MHSLTDSGKLEAALEVFMREVVKMPEYELQAYRQLPMWQERIKIVPTIPRELTINRIYQFNAERYISLQVPTLLLLGSDSPQSMNKATEAIHETLPNSRIVRIAGQQHIAMDIDPELFLSEVTHFLLDEI
jgi:pimeloyl-ACP methyl ester carboxylesterase